MTSTTHTETPADLLAEIARALADQATPARALGELADRAAMAEAASGLLAADARQSAIDPGLAPERVAEALEQANAAAFNVTRLASARETLAALFLTRHDAEAMAARKKARAHAVAERDRVAARLAHEYPALQAKLVDLLSDLMAVNELVDAANRDGRSDNQTIIQRPEGKARGFFDKDELRDDLAGYNLEITRLAQMVVPVFAQPGRLAWPPSLSSPQLQQLRQSQPAYALVRAGFLTSTKSGRGQT